MKRVCLALFAGALLAVLGGCCCERSCCASHPIRDFLGIGQGTCRNAPETGAACHPPCCRVCRGEGCQFCRGGGGGPEMGAVAYPYYNLRGPRDFLARNPASIGP